MNEFSVGQVVKFRASPEIKGVVTGEPFDEEGCGRLVWVAWMTRAGGRIEKDVAIGEIEPYEAAQ